MTTTHLENLRKLMKNMSHVPKILHAYIIPSEDAHQSEYTAECDDRRAFITGFTGSAGTAIVTDTSAALWTDGRYYLQAAQEIDQNWILMKSGLPETPKNSAWLISQFKSLNTKCVVGADPEVLDRKLWQTLKKELTSGGHELVEVQDNLVDVVWGEQRPPQPNNPVTVLEKRWTGKSMTKKLAELRYTVKENGCTAIALTALDDVAYLFNLRGSDIPYNPVFFAYALVTLNDAYLFIAETKLNSDTQEYLKTGGVTVLPYGDFFNQLKKVCSDAATELVWMSSNCSQAVSKCVPAHQLFAACTPVTIAKAIKNQTEIQGMEACHVRDGAALCSFLAWLEKEAPKNSQTEVSAATYLEQCRARQKHFRGLSFPTISSVGANAAIIHYHPSLEHDATITDKHIYLVDSGGHYSDGTTDVTRTVHFGEPSDFEREAFTRVLKGHIALATAVFPDKIKGNYLDSFARQALWAVGLNYGHGTGHGVGMYLNVHEGPMGISWRVYPEDPGMQEGMFVSDEPGFYKDGEFGVRIESIVRVIKADTPYHHNDQDYLTFKAITLAPIQTSLIDIKLMTDQEIEWLNAYHTEVLEEVGFVLQAQQDQQGYDWLVKETKHICKQH